MIMNIEQYLKERVEDQIKWYDKKSQKCQRFYKATQVTEIILAALIPLFSGYVDFMPIPFVIGLFGALISIIESINKLYKFHENWIEYRTTCELLKYQKYLYMTGSFPYNIEPEQIEQQFVKNIEQIISSENNQWKFIHMYDNKKTDDSEEIQSSASSI